MKPTSSMIFIMKVIKTSQALHLLLQPLLSLLNRIHGRIWSTRRLLSTSQYMEAGGQGYRRILESLRSSPNADEAIRITLQKRGSEYSLWKYVRRIYLQDQNNQHPEYMRRLRHFQATHFSPGTEEWTAIDELAEYPLSRKYRVETSRKHFFPNNIQASKELRMITCVPEIFNMYVLPAEYGMRAKAREVAHREAKHSNPINISNLDSIVARARDWRDIKHPWELVSCALILSGRRPCEVVHTMTWEPDGAFTAYIQGLAKQDKDNAVIPLLCPYEEFDELMTKIREHELPTASLTHRLRPAFERVFGQWLAHSQRRNIYGEAGYQMRHVTGFLPTATKIMWIDKALAHSTNVVASAGNLTYQSLTFSSDDE